MIKRIIQIGSVANQIHSDRKNPNRQRVYLPIGVCPTLSCMRGGGLQPYIICKRKEKDERN